ncbi:MAG: hypothetical protein KA419_02115 [Acidobacteria bacterium]|nr:hypothetical protein [Acidobacteriota bacterium]
MTHFLILLFGVTMLYSAATGRLESYVRVLALQGMVLFVLVLLEFDPSHPWSFVIPAVETLGFKAVVIPLFLLRVVRKNEVRRDLSPVLSPFHSLVLAGVIFALGFFLAGTATGAMRADRTFHFGVAVSVILLALLLIVTRRMLITHAIGYMMLENGIFLLSLAVAREMPFLVHLGILLDVFMLIFLLGLFVTKIKSTWDETRVDALVHLRD